MAPPLPTWDDDEAVAAAGPSNHHLADTNHVDDDEESDEEDTSGGGGGGDSKATPKSEGGRNPNKRKRLDQASKLNPKFADPDLEGVEACLDPDEIARVRSEVQDMCGWRGAGFAGAQPVSMDQQNLRFLAEKKYMVSWKADGTR